MNKIDMTSLDIKLLLLNKYYKLVL